MRLEWRQRTDQYCIGAHAIDTINKEFHRLFIWGYYGDNAYGECLRFRRSHAVCANWRGLNNRNQFIYRILPTAGLSVKYSTIVVLPTRYDWVPYF